MDSFITIVFIVLFGVLLSGGLGILLWWGGQWLYIFYAHRHREHESLESVLLQVAVPRDNETKIDAAEQMFASLYSIHKSHGFFHFLDPHPQPHLSFEIVGSPGDIRFFIHTPKKLRDLVEKQINGAYPDAEILVVDETNNRKPPSVVGNEYNIFSERGKVAFASLALKGAPYKPIKVFKDLAVDPLSSITSALAKMTDGEGAAIQIMVAPAHEHWREEGRHHLAKTKKAEANPETAKYSENSKDLEGIENKISKPGFDVVIRVVVSSTSEAAAKAHLDNLLTAISQFNGVNSFKKNKHRFKGLFMNDFLYRYMPMRGHTGVLNSEELATVFHLPNKSVATPNIFWVTAKRAPAPASIPTEGLFLGKSTYRGLAKPVFMNLDDRRRHMYIIGKTGTGKS
jgi:hypothetical protein